MAFTSEHYLLEAFIDGDVYSALADKRRFSSIDNQLNAMTTIVGDGRISGWEIENLTFPNARVTKGSGFIDGYYVATFDDVDFELSANSIFYFYAQRRVGLTAIVGPRSDVATLTYTDAGAPAAPSGFSASSPADVNEYFNIELTWTQNAEVDMDHYDLERSLLPSSEFSVVATISASDMATVTYVDSVDEDQTYYYRLYAVDQSGNRSTAATTSHTTGLSPALPPNPMEVLMPYSEGAINILWKRPNSISFGHISHYELTWVRLDTDGSELTDTTGTRLVSKSVYLERIDNLINGNLYKITLKTVDSKGRKSEGIIKNVAPQDSTAPKDPEGISVTETELVAGSVVLNLSWTDGTDEYDPLVPYRYNIYVTIDGLQESLPIYVPIGETSEQVELYTFDLVSNSSIPQNTLITLRLTSLSENGLESQGNYVRFVTSNFAQPLPVANLSSEFDANRGIVTVTWDNQPDASYIRIQVVDDDLDDDYPEGEIINQNIGLVEIFTFSASLSHRYTITVTPYDVDDVAGPSDVTVEITLLPSFNRPRLPRDLSAQAGDRQVIFTWRASPDVTVAFYKVYRKSGTTTTIADDWTLLDTLPSTIKQFENYGLENDQIYSYYVTSVDLYGLESLHLPDGAVNLNYIEVIPRSSGILTEPDNLQTSLVGNDVLLTWESLAEEFDSFVIYRSVGNLHLWENIATVDRNTVSYLDEDLPLIDGTTFYYTVGKTLNDSDIVAQVSNVAPESSILLGSLTLGAVDFGSLDISDRRDIGDMEDPIAEYTDTYLLTHKHEGLDRFDPERIDLRPSLVITDWDTIDARIFTTEETDISGSGYVVKVDGRFPPVLFEIDTTTRRLIFAEPLARVDTSGNIIGDLPEIEVRVLGVEEVQNVLSDDRFDDIHARQVAYGKLNQEQMPDINHEGRIREIMLPKSYLLERYSDHTFIVPQANTDTTKTFGDGTTFYAVIEADGLIDEVIDWDQEDDGAIVGFRQPSFSDTTILNLKQNLVNSYTDSNLDEANEYRLKDDQLFCIADGTGATDRYLFTVDATAPSNVNNIGNTTIETEDACFHPPKHVLLIMTISTTEHTEIYSPDILTANIFEADGTTTTLRRGYWGKIPRHSLSVDYDLSAMEYHSDGKLYVIYADNSRLASLDLDSVDEDNFIAMTEIGTGIFEGSGYSASAYAMAYDSTNNVMYVASSAGTNRLWTLNVNTGVATLVHSTNLLSSGFTSLTYDASADKLYGLDGSVGPTDSELYEINRTTGLDVSLGTFTPPTTWTHAFAAAPSDQSLWLTNNYVEDSVLTLTSSPGVYSDVYLRFPVNLNPSSVLGFANLILTAHDRDYSTGDIELRISVLDPAEVIDSVDFRVEAVKNVSTLASLDWTPAEWNAEEEISVDIRSLIQQFIESSAFFEGRHMLIKIETLATSADDSIRVFYSVLDSSSSPRLELSYVVDSAEVTDEQFFQSEKSYHFAFEFEDNQQTRWVRVTSFDAPVKPNPIIDLKKRLKFKVLLQDGSVYLALGVREIALETAETGDNGGTTGPIEWVGADDSTTDSEGNITPIGKLVTSSSNWQEVEFDLEKDSVIAFSSDANGILEGSFGVLEHLAFTIVPDDIPSSGVFDIYIDKMEQVDDVLTAGSSQGILLSRDFGTSWENVRYVETPVHKFYRATNNPFIWAVATNTVLLSVDPENWFETSGLTGVQYIRDIAEDDLGNMYVSTDKGVYWFEIALINHFSSWRQTQPVNAFSTDCYGLYHKPGGSALDEIWVSTEIGIYKTMNQGQTWVDTNMDTEGLPAYQFINISSDPVVPNVICITRKHVLRKLGTETDFSVLANFEVQHNVFDIWTMEYFADHLYVSTGSGVYSNSVDELVVPNITTTFDRIFPKLDMNGQVGVAFGLDAVTVDSDLRQLFIGQENRLMVADEDNVLSIKEQFPNKELPSFFQNGTELTIGFVYNAFNNVLVFREPQPVNDLYRAAHVPRKIFLPTNGGWAQTNPETDVFIYVNGLPKWLDFRLDESDLLGELQNLQGKLSPLEGTLTDFNSLHPDASDKLTEVLADITNMIQGGEGETPLINNTTIIQFMEDYTRFLSLITEAVILANELDTFPQINLTGFPASQRESNSRAELLEEQEDFTANNSTGINIDTVAGEVDFLTVFTTTTDTTLRQDYVFDKYDKMDITIFNANVSGTGEFTHRELEDSMEAVNSGLSSHLTRSHYTNMIKAGIFLESRHPFLFETYRASNVQSKFYAAHTNDWYDIVNSTVDYNSILEVENLAESRFSNVMHLFSENPYLMDRLWIGTDNDILQYQLSSGQLTQEGTVRPGDGLEALFIWDIFVLNEDDIYVVAEEKENQIGHIYRTTNGGNSWSDLETINLPQKIYTFTIMSGNKIAGTESGIYYSDNNFGTWFPGSLTLSSQAGAPSTEAFSERIRNITATTFLAAESDRWFYTSGSGLDWFALGRQMTTNGVTTINKILRFKSLTWAATDKGLYNDANSILSDSVQFGLERLEDTVTDSTQLNVSDIAAGVDSLYCSAGNMIYRLLDGEWLSYEVDEVSGIHKILLDEGANDYLIVISHNLIKSVDVTPGSGVFG